MTRQPCVLVVDDEERLIRFVRANLESVGYRVITASDGWSAIDLAEADEPDLVILDIMLPDMDGFEVCRRLREFSTVPIIILTAKVGEDDKVKGLRLGADDYITKPFGVKELLARVEAVLRRTKLSDDGRHQEAVLTFEDVVIDFGKRKVKVGDEEVKLTATEYRLLYQLATNAGRVMLHEELLSRVWGQEYRGETDYLKVYIRRLRQKLEKDPREPQHILSRAGIGYEFVMTS